MRTGGIMADWDWKSAGNGADAIPFPLEFFHTIQPSLDASDFVEGLLTSAAMSVIYGESTSGKTFFATDLGLHVARGGQWNGRDIDRGAVIYCALEGSHGIRNRVAAFRTFYGLDDAELPFAVVPVNINMLDATQGEVDRLIQTIKFVMTKMGMPVVLIIMDTLSRAMAGGNENTSEDMGSLVINGARIQQETGAHVCWVHHSGKDSAKGARGHSLLRAATDTEIEIVVEGHARTATVMKQRDMECVGTFNFELEVVELGTNRRGKPVTSCVVQYGDMETSEDVSNVSRGRKVPTGRPQVAYRILCDLVSEAGESGHRGAPDGVLTVPEEWWRERFYDRALPGADRKTREKAYRRAADTLIEHHAIACSGERVWLG